MQPYSSLISTTSESFDQRRQGMLERVRELRALEQRAADQSARAKPIFDKRGALLPRERVARFLVARRRLEKRDRPLRIQHQLLARMLGMRAETLSRALGKLRLRRLLLRLQNKVSTR